MNAFQICKDIYKWIQDKEKQGQVHSVFKNTINILSDDGRFIPLIVNNKPMFPNSIKLDSVLDLNKLNLAIGEKCIFAKTRLFIGHINISYDSPTIWDKEVKLIPETDTYENFKSKLDIMKEFILNKGNKDGIFQLMEFINDEFFSYNNYEPKNKSQLFIKERFINYINNFIGYDIVSINTFSKKIIGFGPGLTPSMDDFISGMMIANIYISHLLGLDLKNAYLLNHEIVKDIHGMTTTVSEEMLKLSSLGEANEDIRDLMIALIGIDGHKEKLNELLVKVISLGHSSGTDILCGIYIASHILMGKEE